MIRNISGSWWFSFVGLIIYYIITEISHIIKENVKNRGDANAKRETGKREKIRNKQTQILADISLLHAV